MSDLFDKLLGPGEPSPEFALLSKFARALRAVAQEEDLAEGDCLDVVFANDEEARQSSREDEESRMALAAAPHTVARLYQQGTWLLRWGVRADGGVTVQLAGPGPAELWLGDRWVPLTPDVWTAVTGDPAPELQLRLTDGHLIRLRLSVP